MCAHVSMFVCVHAYVRTCVRICVCTCVHFCVCTRMRVRAHVCAEGSHIHTNNQCSTCYI